MTSQTKLWALSAGALALSLALAGCGGGGSSSGPAAAADTTPPAQEVETPTPTPASPRSVTSYVTLPAGLDAAAFDLPVSGNAVTFTVMAGMSLERGGASFTCTSSYDCEVTVTNNGGTPVAKQTSQADADADDPTVTAMALPMDPPAMRVYLDLPAGHSLAIDVEAGETHYLTILPGETETAGGVDFSCPAGGESCVVRLRNAAGVVQASYWDENSAEAMLALAPVPRNPLVVGGAMRANGKLVHGLIAEMGLIVTYTDVNMAAGATAVPDPAEVNELQHPGTFELQGDFVEVQEEPAGTAADPDPIIKSTQTDADGGPELNADGLDISAADLATWRVHSLERDWAHRLPEEPADAPLYGGFVTNALVGENIGSNKTRAFDELFTLNMDGELVSLLGNPSSNGGMAMFTYDGVADTYQNGKDQSEDFRGSFAGVSGLFRCSDADCWLVKDRMKGTVSVQLGMDEPDGNFAALEFVPDNADDMASVPDWAWMAFGAWLTTPNDDDGQHSLGLIATGGGLADMLPETEYYAVLEGEATYKGVALGYYVDDATSTAPETGTFTATATLNVDFDADNNISGTVSNFHNANGEAMNEFVVDLVTETLGATGGAAGMTSGHANGVDWAGSWAAQLGGAPDDNVDGISFTTGMASADVNDLSADSHTTSAADHPLGATGTFDAHNSASAVTGAFGADLQPPAE